MSIIIENRTSTPLRPAEEAALRCGFEQVAHLFGDAKILVLSGTEMRSIIYTGWGSRAKGGWRNVSVPLNYCGPARGELLINRVSLRSDTPEEVAETIAHEAGHAVASRLDYWLPRLGWTQEEFLTARAEMAGISGEGLLEDWPTGFGLRVVTGRRFGPISDRLFAALGFPVREAGHCVGQDGSG